MPAPTASERSQIARLGGLTRAAMHDSRAMTAPARDAFLRRFEDEVDPERTLSPAERQKRAEAARKAHMTRLALRSAQARRKRKGAA